MSELNARLKTAGILAAVFISLLLLAKYFIWGEWVLKGIVAIGFITAVAEYFVFSRSENSKYELALILIPVLIESYNSYFDTYYSPFVVLILALFLISFVKSRDNINNIPVIFSKLALPSMYFGIGLGSIILFLSNLDYLKNLVFLILVIITTDTMAYVFGKKFGKNPLILSVSPGKTIEGTAGGVLSGALVAVACWGVHLWFVALLIPVAAQLSDLVESYFKRINNVKDSSNLLPGHGGVLDRLDSYFLTVPILVYLFS